jgi:hypothetical protein
MSGKLAAHVQARPARARAHANLLRRRITKGKSCGVEMARMNKKIQICAFYYYKKRESRISASVAGSATGLDLLALFFLSFFFCSESYYSLFPKRARRGKV